MLQLALFSVDYTAQEYFETNAKSLFPNADASIAATCIAYLSFDVFAKGYHDFCLKKNPLLKYAASYWGNHGSQNLETGMETIQEFLEKKPNVDCACQALNEFYKRSGSESEISQSSGIYLLPYFGLAEIMAYQFAKGAKADFKDTFGQTPLAIAAEWGHEGVVRLLLEQSDVKVDSTDKIGYSPLSLAITNNHEGVVKLLLARDGVNVNSKSIYGHSPLSLAAANRLEESVRLLLERGDAEVNSKTENNRSPLSFAAKNGHEGVVRLLLAQGDVEADSKDIDGYSPLLLAAKNGHEVVVGLLLEREDVWVNSKTEYHRSLLSFAAENGYRVFIHEETLRLARRVCVVAWRCYGCSPPKAAMWRVSTQRKR